MQAFFTKWALIAVCLALLIAWGTVGEHGFIRVAFGYLWEWGAAIIHVIQLGLQKT